MPLISALMPVPPETTQLHGKVAHGSKHKRLYIDGPVAHITSELELGYNRVGQNQHLLCRIKSYRPAFVPGLPYIQGGQFLC